LLYSNVSQFVRREIGEIVRLVDKKNKFRLPLKLSLLRGSHQKSVRSSPQHLAHIF